MWRRLSLPYVAILVNLLLWLAVLSSAYRGDSQSTKTAAVIGCVVAALTQHWAYYKLQNATEARR